MLELCHDRGIHTLVGLRRGYRRCQRFLRGRSRRGSRFGLCRGGVGLGGGGVGLGLGRVGFSLGGGRVRLRRLQSGVRAVVTACCGDER